MTIRILFIIFTLTTPIICTPNYMPGFPEFIPPIIPTLNPTQTSTENTYPNVNSNGFVEMKLSGRDYTDDLTKLDTIRQDPMYKKIPNEIMKGSPKLENRYNVELEGHLDKDTEVKYSIQKEPDFPGIYNVYIRKKTTELQFGDFNTTYKSGDYINVEKYLNGVETNTNQSQWKGKATLGKEKSEPQKFETFGTDTKVYKVGKSFLLEGSVIVYVNNKKLKENDDYSVNYYEGSIIFNENKNKIDFIKVIYEFTNPVQDFIPALSRKNFTAATYTYNPSQNVLVETPITVTHNMNLVIKDQNNILSNQIYLPNAPIKLGSESIYLNSKLLKRSLHYFIKNDTGLVRFNSKQLAFDDSISATYQYYKTTMANETIFSTGSPGPYPLKHKHILSETLTVNLNGIEAREFIDYIYKKSSNSILFYYPVASNKVLQIQYKYKLFNEENIGFETSPFSLELTQLNESTSVRENISTYQNNVAPLSIENNTITLQNNPLDSSKSVTIEIDGRPLEASEYQVNHYKGTITLNTPQTLIMSNVKTSYHYLDTLHSEHSIKGLSTQSYSQDQIEFKSLPIKYNGIQKLTIFNPNEMVLEEGRDYTIEYFTSKNGDKDEFSDIKITFILGGYSILDSYPNSSDVIKFDYLYIPNLDSTKANSTHTVTDLRLRKKISDDWNVYTEIANSNYNYSKTSIQKDKEFTTQQPDNIYKLEQNKSIEEHSEMIFINGFSQTRDIDYYINYEKAEVRFINKTIPDNQKVEIAYNIYESDKPNKKNVNAYAIESHYSPNNHIQITNKYQTTDPNFLPIGNININKGTSKFIHEINWLMNQNESASFLYENESIQSIDYENRYKKHHYLSTLNFNLFIFDTSHEILYDDITSSNNYKESTKKVIKYENTFNYNFSDDNINISNSISQKNERPQIDTSLNSLITSSKIEYNNNFKIKKWINSGTISPYFSKSTDKTNKKDTSSYQQKNVENIGFNASTKMNDQIQNMTTFDKGTYQTLLTSDEKFIDTYYNYSHNSTITPFPWLNSNVNISHEESISPIPGQENKVEDREGYNIVQLANDAALEYLNAPSFILSRFKGSYSNLGLSKTKKRENNRLKNYKENRYFGAINALKPFEGFNIPKFKFDTYNSTLSDKKTSTYQTFSSSNTKFYSYDTGFTFRPNLHHLNRLSFDSTLTESKSNVLSNLTLTTGTTNTTTSVVYNQTQKFGVNINAPTIPLLITSIMSPSIRLEQNKKTKIDENNTQSSDPTNNAFLLDNNLIKENKLKLNYKVFRIFKLTNSASDEESYYNRNKISTIKGSLFRKKIALDQGIQYSLFRHINNKEYVKYETIDEYKTNDINISKHQIMTSNDNHLNLQERLANHETTLSLSRFLSLKGTLEYQDFKQNIASNNTTINNEFLNQNKGTSGLIIHPISGLNISYDYTIKQLRRNNENNVKGNSDLIKITYNPIKYENMAIQFNLSKEKNWGFGFNTIQKTQLFQTNNESMSIQIVPRNDELYLGSLNLNITLPIKNSEHLEKVIISGEGYYKKIVDLINPKNSLMINGLLFNVRIEL